MAFYNVSDQDSRCRRAGVIYAGRTTFSCAAACSFSAFARFSLYCCSSGFSGLDFCAFEEGSAPASMIDMVAAEGVATSAIMGDNGGGWN